MDKVYIGAAYNKELVDLIKKVCQNSQFQNDVWALTKVDWEEKIRPWFVTNKVHYDLGMLDQDMDLIVKDTSQKFPITIQKTDKKLYINGGITDTCRKYLKQKGSYDSKAGCMTLAAKDQDEFIQFCNDNNLQVDMDPESKVAQTVLIWIENGMIHLKGDIDSRSLLSQIKEARFDSKVGDFVLPTSCKRELDNFLYTNNIRNRFPYIQTIFATDLSNHYK